MFGTSVAMKDAGGYIRADDISKLIEAGLNERDKLLMMTLFNTGRRVSEIVGELGIRPYDIDVRGSTIAFTVLKKKKDITNERPRRRKYVPASLCLALDSYAKGKNMALGDPIFDFTRQCAFQICKHASIKSGVRTISGRIVHPHHFRHTFVTQRVLDGLKWEEALQLRDYMEHSNITITESYTHIDPTKQRMLFKEEPKIEPTEPISSIQPTPEPLISRAQPTPEPAKAPEPEKPKETPKSEA